MARSVVEGGVGGRRVNHYRILIAFSGTGGREGTSRNREEENNGMTREGISAVDGGIEGLIIRGAVEGDLEAILDITKRAWDGVNIAQLREERHGIVGGKRWYEHKCEEIAGGFRRGPQWFIVAELNGRVVGYASFGYIADATVGVVGNNAVDPDFQGRGIGTRLISRVVEILKEKGATVLQVSTLLQDKPAQRVYEKVGFKELARSIHYTMSVKSTTPD